MKKRKCVRKFMAIVLCLALLLPQIICGATAADEVQITVMISDENVILPPTMLNVAPDTAQKYGYTDDENTVSVFDVFVASHEYLLGDAFTSDTAKDYLNITESGYVDLILGDSRASGFLVDGIQPNDGVLNPLYGSYTAYTADKSILSGGETVNLFFYQDVDYYTDYYSFFNQSEIVTNVGEEISLNLNGYMTMWGSYPIDMIEEYTEPISDIAIVFGNDANNLTAGGITTDDSGGFSIRFDSAGTYYISAESASDDFTYFIQPWCQVTVEAGDTPIPSDTPSDAPTETPTEAPTVAPTPNIDLDARSEFLMENISKSYTNTDDAWALMDMARGGYGDLLADKASSLQGLIDKAYASESIGELSKNALAIRSLNGNLEKLKTSAGEEFDLIKKLSSFDTKDITYVTDAVFALLTYDSGNYTSNGNLTRGALLEYILTSRTGDGIWGYEWNGQNFPDYDSSAMVLAALGKYYTESSAQRAGISESRYREIQTAVDDIVSILSSVQDESGTFHSSNTDAMVIVGLAAIGTDPRKDERFIKGGNSVIAGLMSYALEDNSGFGFTDNSEFNAMATEQAFRALIALKGFESSEGKVYNVYTGDELKPSSGNSGSHGSGGFGGSGGFSGQNITVTITVKGDTVHGDGKHSGSYPTWIPTVKKTFPSGTRVAAALKSVLTENKYSAEGIDSGYIKSITTPEGMTLGERDNGKNSGWLYTVNGTRPNVGIDSYTLKDGDDLVLYYSDDYTADSPASGGSGGVGTGDSASGGTPSPSSAPTLQPTSSPSGNSEEVSGPKDVDPSHWAFPYISSLIGKGIFGGYEDGTFRPENNITRAEITAVFYRAFGIIEAEPPTEPVFTDVKPEDWSFEYVAWAYDSGYIIGYPDGSFSPDEDITREDICVILQRIRKNSDIVKEKRESIPFADEAEISDYAKDAVSDMRNMGIIEGKEDNLFDPKAPATRAEVCKMVYTLL